nr:60S acidic ribosomal protein P0 [Ipomoea batatas]
MNKLSPLCLSLPPSSVVTFLITAITAGPSPSSPFSHHHHHPSSPFCNPFSSPPSPSFFPFLQSFLITATAAGPSPFFSLLSPPSPSFFPFCNPQLYALIYHTCCKNWGDYGVGICLCIEGRCHHCFTASGPARGKMGKFWAIFGFSYGLIVLSVYDNGSVFSPEVLDLTEDDLIEKFAMGVSMVTSLSLAISYPTLVAAPHMLINGFKFAL